tara:strand:- start:689 stop:1705 length:1017 start_codon:yes stop_codon:yes gene_type:complete
MRFASLGGSNAGNYAAAGKAVADSGARMHAVQRKTGPDYAGLSKVAMQTASNEKVAGMQAEAKLTNVAQAQYAKNTQNEIKIEVFNKGEEIKNKQRKAGGLAAIGKIAGAGFLAATDNTKGRERPKADRQSILDSFKSKNEASQTKYDADSAAHGTFVAPEFKPSARATTSGGSTPGKAASSTPVSSVSTPMVTGDGTYDGSFGSVYKMAENSGAQFPALVAAQWQLESGAGKAISGKNNFFGIKATGSEAGTQKNTWEENSAGQAYNTSARFKDFESPQASVNELVGRWHQDYKGYKGVNNAPSRADAARMLSSEGYATDSKYADKLIRIMSEQGYS